MKMEASCTKLTTKFFTCQKSAMVLAWEEGSGVGWTSQTSRREQSFECGERPGIGWTWKPGREQLQRLLLDLPDSVVCEELSSWIHRGGMTRQRLFEEIVDFRERAQVFQSSSRTTSSNVHAAHQHSLLQKLPGSIIGRLWPGERVVTGLMTSKWLRNDLLAHAEEIHIEAPFCRLPGNVELSRQFESFKRMRMTLRWVGDLESIDPVVRHLDRIGMEKLCSLELSNYSFGGETIPASLCCQLSRVSFQDCGLVHHEDMVVSLLSSCTSLSHLDLSSNDLAPPQIQTMLAAAAQHCPGLSHLDLSENCFGTTNGMEHPPLSSLRLCTSITVLDLGWNNLRDGGAQMLADVVPQLPRLTSLCLGNNLLDFAAPGFHQLMAQLRQVSTLEKLDMPHNSRVPVLDERLDMHGNIVPGSNYGILLLALLLDQGRLVQLNLQNCGLSDANGERLAVSLATCTRLTLLNVHSNHLGRRAALALQELRSRSTLTHLDLGDNFQAALPSDFEQLLTSLPHLRHLDLQTVAEKTPGFFALEGLTNLKTLALGWTSLGKQELGRGIPLHAIELRKVLARNPRLEALNLNKCSIGCEFANTLFAASTLGTTIKFLRQLDLGQNRIGSCGFGSVAGWLAECKAIEIFILSDNNIGTAGASLLAPLLKQWPGLLELRLNGNAIGEEGVQKLAWALLDCQRLWHLDLSSNVFGDDGAKLVASLLRRGLRGEPAGWSRLEEVLLESNLIGDEGGAELLGALEAADTVICLKLQGNRLTEDSDTAVGLRKYDTELQ